MVIPPEGGTTTRCGFGPKRPTDHFGLASLAFLGEFGAVRGDWRRMGRMGIMGIIGMIGDWLRQKGGGKLEVG